MVENTPIFVSVRQAVKLTGLSIKMLYDGIHSGKYPAIQSGNKFLVHYEELCKILTDESKRNGGISA